MWVTLSGLNPILAVTVGNMGRSVKWEEKSLPSPRLVGRLEVLLKYKAFVRVPGPGQCPLDVSFCYGAGDDQGGHLVGGGRGRSQADKASEELRPLEPKQL